MNNIIAILNDGETYTSLEGCTVAFLDDRAMELVNQGDAPCDADASEVFDLTNPVHLRMLADHLEKLR